MAVPMAQIARSVPAIQKIMAIAWSAAPLMRSLRVSGEGLSVRDMSLLYAALEVMTTRRK